MVVLSACDLEISNQARRLALRFDCRCDSVSDEKRDRRRDRAMSNIHEVDRVTEDMRDLEPAKTILGRDKLVIVDTEIKLQGQEPTKVHITFVVGKNNVGGD